MELAKDEESIEDVDEFSAESSTDEVTSSGRCRSPKSLDKVNIGLDGQTYFKSILIIHLIFPSKLRLNDLDPYQCDLYVP